MAIDARDGAIRMLNRLALGEIFNWISWRDGEILWFHKDVRTGRTHSGLTGQANNVMEGVLTDSVATGYANFRLTHETDVTSTSITDGFGATLIFSVRGIGASGFGTNNLAAIDAIRTGANNSGSLVFRTLDATAGFREVGRWTNKGVLAFGLSGPTAAPDTNHPGLKNNTSALEVRRSDDSNYGPINFLTQAAGTNTVAGATTAWVQGEFTARATRATVANAATLPLPTEPTSYSKLVIVSTSTGTITAFSGGTQDSSYVIVNSTGGNLTITQGGNLVVRGGSSLVLAAGERASLTCINPTTQNYTVQ